MFEPDILVITSKIQRLNLISLLFFSISIIKIKIINKKGKKRFCVVPEKNTALSFMVEKIAGEKKRLGDQSWFRHSLTGSRANTHKHICNSYASFLML